MLKLVRVFLVLVVALLSLVIFLELTGHATYYDVRVVRAFGEHMRSGSPEAERELDGATAALHLRRTMLLVGMTAVLFLASAGIVRTTRAIRAQTSNQAMQRTAR